MIYMLIQNPDNGDTGYMEMFNNAVVRLTDLDGNTKDFPCYQVTDASPTPPSWALPDPEPEAPPPAADPVPDVITKRQFLIQLLRSGMVTEAEAPTVAVQPPASITSIFSGLPTEAALEVAITWAAMTQVERHNPLIDMAVSANLMTDPDLDDFFRAAALI